ncbi:uncharacterized protein LOC133201655 [Saccostrea echinata]|uniref:uncharacterized protein LOC133201655 n=1 Tax=Saccostrea echinata TaxID=191078 RepID=UPI002A8147EF|nr:uncharacterized protein LOC133201655 [Saccostrea echinata]
MADNEISQHFLSCHFCNMDVQFFCKPCGKRLCRECLLQHMDLSELDHVIVPYNKRFKTVEKSIHDPEVTKVIPSGLNTMICVRYSDKQKIYVAENGAPLLKLFNTEGHLLDVYKPKNIVRFFTPTKDGFLYTASEGIRKVNDVGDTFLLPLEGSLRGIAFVKPETVFICNITPPKISKYNMKGEKLLEIEHSDGKHLFQYPDNIAINGNGDICVTNPEFLLSDKGTSSVVVFNRQGDFRFSYCAHKDELFHPVDICCNSNSDMIIADDANSKLHVINEDGRLLRFLTYEGIHRPCSVTKDNNDRLYVSQLDDKSLRIIHYFY